MFRAVVYDDGIPSTIIEEFTGENELKVFRSALYRRDWLRRHGHIPKGNFTMRLERKEAKQ